jgi:hypothetical protein
VSQQILYHTVFLYSITNVVVCSYRTQLPAIKASGEESCSIKAQPMLEQDTVVSFNCKDEDTADSCSLGSEKSSTHSRSVSYLQILMIFIQNFLCIWWPHVGPHIPYAHLNKMAMPLFRPIPAYHGDLIPVSL